MARTYLVFGDIEGKLDMLRVECARSLQRPQADRKIWAPSQHVMKWKEQLNGDCPKRDAPLHDRCRFNLSRSAEGALTEGPDPLAQSSRSGTCHQHLVGCRLERRTVIWSQLGRENQRIIDEVFGGQIRGAGHHLERGDTSVAHRRRCDACRRRGHPCKAGRDQGHSSSDKTKFAHEKLPFRAVLNGGMLSALSRPGCDSHHKKSDFFSGAGGWVFRFHHSNYTIVVT
jgi:hypothetical protein